ncbi:MAG TPA: sigma-70 family RNA polymerase sigma factor [Candidatus Cybelea sp.]|jgi:RNA polymerase sigma-70 factor, ECF subfamily|nr:sigma-70 family RNA polymerase sigma factor [Candidatus Cybelea sp.]
MTQTTDLADALLLRRIAGGDEEAFAEVYRQRQAAIYRFALHMTGNSALAEDVTQEVFMALIRDPKRFDPARGTLGGFLFGVARNHLRKRWERDRRLVPFDGDPDDLRDTASAGAQSRSATDGSGANGNGHGAFAAAASWDEFASIEIVGRVRQAVGTLPENYREVVVLCELQEMSYEEAASALGCPVGTVRSRLHRARAMLVEKLRESHPVRPVSAVGE